MFVMIIGDLKKIIGRCFSGGEEFDQVKAKLAADFDRDVFPIAQLRQDAYLYDVTFSALAQVLLLSDRTLRHFKDYLRTHAEQSHVEKLPLTSILMIGHLMQRFEVRDDTPLNETSQHILDGAMAEQSGIISIRDSHASIFLHLLQRDMRWVTDEDEEANLGSEKLLQAICFEWAFCQDQFDTVQALWHSLSEGPRMELIDDIGAPCFNTAVKEGSLKMAGWLWNQATRNQQKHFCLYDHVSILPSVDDEQAIDRRHGIGMFDTIVEWVLTLDSPEVLWTAIGKCGHDQRFSDQYIIPYIIDKLSGIPLEPPTAQAEFKVVFTDDRECRLWVGIATAISFLSSQWPSLSLYNTVLLNNTAIADDFKSIISKDQRAGALSSHALAELKQASLSADAFFFYCALGDHPDLFTSPRLVQKLQRLDAVAAVHDAFRHMKSSNPQLITVTNIEALLTEGDNAENLARLLTGHFPLQADTDDEADSDEGDDHESDWAAVWDKQILARIELSQLGPAELPLVPQLKNDSNLCCLWLHLYLRLSCVRSTDMPVFDFNMLKALLMLTPKDVLWVYDIQWMPNNNCYDILTDHHHSPIAHIIAERLRIFQITAAAHAPIAVRRRLAGDKESSMRDALVRIARRNVNKLSAQYPKIGEDEPGEQQLLAIEKKIRRLLLWRIAVENREHLPFIAKNIASLSERSDPILNAEAVSKFTDLSSVAQIAWRAYESTAPTLAWVNLLAPAEDDDHNAVVASTPASVEGTACEGGEINLNQASNDLRRIVAQCFQIIIDDKQTFSPEVRVAMMDSFVANVAQMRRGNNLNDDERDNPTCHPGGVSRAGMILGEHPDFESVTPIENLPFLVKKVVSSAVNQAVANYINSLTSGMQRRLLLSALTVYSRAPELLANMVAAPDGIEDGLTFTDEDLCRLNGVPPQTPLSDQQQAAGLRSWIALTMLTRSKLMGQLLGYEQGKLMHQIKAELSTHTLDEQPTDNEINLLIAENLSDLPRLVTYTGPLMAARRGEEPEANPEVNPPKIKLGISRVAAKP